MRKILFLVTVLLVSLVVAVLKFNNIIQNIAPEKNGEVTSVAIWIAGFSFFLIMIGFIGNISFQYRRKI